MSEVEQVKIDFEPTTHTFKESDIGKNPKQVYEQFLTRNIRQIFLIFQNDKHKEVVAALKEIIKANKLKNNAEAVCWLLSYYEEHKGCLKLNEEKVK